MNDLVRLLREFEPGDLIGMTEIIEAAEAAADDAPTDEARSACEEIRSTFRGLALGEEHPDLDGQTESWCRALSADQAPAADTEPDSGGALEFLGSASGRLATIVDLLKRYSTGNLPLATEILAETQALINDPTTPEDVLPAIRGVRDSFFAHVRDAELASAEGTADQAPGNAEHAPVEAAAVGEPSPIEAVAEGDRPENEVAAEQAEAESSEPQLAGPEHTEIAPAAPLSIPVDDLEIVRSFIQESTDHLEDIEDRVLTLEHNYTDELLNSVFRSFHTIKGVASFVGFTYISETSHDLETLLDDVREGDREFDESIATVVLDGTDTLRHIIGDIERQLHESGGKLSALTEESFGHREIVERVKAIREGREFQASSPPPATNEPDVADAPIVTQDIIDAFVEESTDLLDEVEQTLLSAESAPIPPESVDRIFRAIHTVKGNAGFFWFSRIEQSCMAMETALDEVRGSGASLASDGAGEFLSMLDTVRASVQSVVAASAGVQRAVVDRDDLSGDEDAGETNVLGEILIQMGELSPESLQRALATQQRKLGEILVNDEHVAPDSVRKALEEQTKRRIANPAKTSEYSANRKDIRVDTTKLDKLFDLVGELITAESMVLSGLASGAQNGSVAANGSSNGNVTQAASYLEKITREMQEITLSIRMIPLEATFGKMRRLVRDLSKRFEKNVAIEISGEQTEMDKNVIEAISDPLVHVIRNAVDHGIEDADVRVRAGKPERGTIKLSAKHEGNEIWITVEDDGKGLNRDRILAKAIERGMVDEDAEPPSDEQIYRFVFEPAFSTADQVSEISGRGVGMDVVRQNIDKLRGRIDLHSTPGQGTTFVLRIPLTLAILDGVTFAIGGSHFSVPTTDLVTFQSYDDSRITRTSADHHGFRIRDEVVPIIQYEHREVPPEHGVVIVLQSDERQVALVVDEIVGYQQFVVRALPSYMGTIRAVSGCSIMGDGSISFILDVAQLVEQELERVESG